MRNMIVGFVVGVLLVMGGMYVISQESYTGDTWEYATFRVIDSDENPPFGPWEISSYLINGSLQKFDSPVPFFQVMDALGSQGWEYADTINNRMLFKRRMGN